MKGIVKKHGKILSNISKKYKDYKKLVTDDLPPAEFKVNDKFI